MCLFIFNILKENYEFVTRKLSNGNYTTSSIFLFTADIAN